VGDRNTEIDWGGFSFNDSSHVLGGWIVFYDREWTFKKYRGFDLVVYPYGSCFMVVIFMVAKKASTKKGYE